MSCASGSTLDMLRGCSLKVGFDHGVVWWNYHDFLVIPRYHGNKIILGVIFILKQGHVIAHFTIRRNLFIEKNDNFNEIEKVKLVFYRHRQNFFKQKNHQKLWKKLQMTSKRKRKKPCTFSNKTFTSCHQKKRICRSLQISSLIYHLTLHPS